MVTQVTKVYNAAGGSGVDFTTTGDAMNYINGLDLIALDQNVSFQIVGNFQFPSYMTFGPTTSDDTHKVTYCPAPGQNVNQLDTAVFNEATDGAGIRIIHGRSQTAKPGQIFEDLRVYAFLDASGSALTTSGTNPNLTKWDVEFHRCRFLDVGAVATQTLIVGNNYCRTLIDDCLGVVDGAQHVMFAQQSPCRITNSTLVARNAGLNASMACNLQGDSLLFIGFGATASGDVPVTNSYANTPQSSGGVTYVAGTNAMVVNESTDFRPKAGSPIIGAGGTSARSTTDILGNNRGQTPDVGAWQLTPAIDLPTGTITSITVSGQSVTISGTTTGTPTSGQASIAPTADANNNAVGQGPIAVTLGAGTFSATFAATHSGKYSSTVTLTNSGGTGSAGGASTFEVSGAAGVITSQVLDGQQLTISGTTSGTPTSGTVMIPPAATPNGASQIGPLAVMLGSGTFSVAITVQPGSYAAPQVVFDSAYGKSFPATGGAAFAVVGISGNPDGTAGSGSGGSGGSTADTTAPVMSGAISTSAITASGFTMSVQAGTDNVGIALYEYSTDGGATYTANGTNLSLAVTGKAAATTYALRARAKDAAGNVSNVLVGSVTTAASSGGGGSTVRTITLSLVNLAQAPAANLAGLKWAWFDQATPNLFAAPTDKGNLESTDANGAITISLPNSALSVGQTGWLIVTDSDGNPATLHDAFSGPVTVA